MSSTVFRSPAHAEAQKATPPVTSKKTSELAVPRGVDVDVEAPFSDYETMEGHPYLVDHYELGTLWDQGDEYSPAAKLEVSTINAYLKHVIDSGEVNNTVESVKKELKRVEKMINVRPDQRKSMRLALVAEYAKFLLQSENIKKESAKYGMI